jgi:xylan 1,4-beta-xylosidase
MSDKSVKIHVDGRKWMGDLAHNWNYIGYDELNYTYTPESQELLAKFMNFQEKPYYIRAHHLLCNGNCHGFYKWGSTNVYTEDENGNPVYFWPYVDLVFDTILKYKCKPFVELGFMPKDLVSPEHLARIPQQAGWHSDYLMYQSYGWTCPPKDYQKWYDLIFNMVKHSIERYGLEEVKSWYWELWNEPDIRYWGGTIEEFNKLYDYTVAAVKAACPDARVGGPSVTNPDLNRNSGKYLDIFLDHCHNGKNYATGAVGTPLDFITFHVKGGGYPMDPKAKKGVPPSVKRILRDVKTGYEIISKYSGYKDLECILSEIDPDGWAAGGQMDNANFEFRNTEYYPSFVAASFDKVSKFAKKNNWDLRLLSWAYLFVGERCFEGTRSFSTQGIDKSILNLFRMYAKTGVKQLAMDSSGEKDPLAYSDMIGKGVSPDISGFASFTPEKSLEILVYNHHDDWDLSENWEVDLEVANAPFDAKEFRVAHYRVDATHSNAYPEWVRQGKPMYPEGGQKAAIKARESLELLEPVQTVAVSENKVKLSFTLPVHGISLFVLSPVSA